MERTFYKRVVVFILRGFGVWLAWYVLYNLWLEPQENLDHTLCSSLAFLGEKILQLNGFAAFLSDRTVGLSGMPGIILIDPCDGLEAMGIFLGFIHAFPGGFLRRWLFSTAGLLTIYLTNVMRVVALVLTQRYWPGMFDITHHYSSTAIFYLVIFGLWIFWARWGIAPAGKQVVKPKEGAL